MKGDQQGHVAKTMFMVGRGLEVVQFYTVGLYEPESGAVLHRHTVTVLRGGAPLSQEEAVRATTERAKRFIDFASSDRDFQVRMKTDGKTLVPLEKLKTVVSSDPAHRDVEFRVEPKTGAIVVIEDAEEQQRRKMKA